MGLALGRMSAHIGIGQLERRLVLLQGRRILLIISGGIAAYKSLELIRRLRERGAAVRCILTAAAAHFVKISALPSRPAVARSRWALLSRTSCRERRTCSVIPLSAK